jgi:RNA polymerase sigma factor (sigma-70 family)
VHLAGDVTTLHSAAEAALRAALRAGLREPDARDLAQEALVRALTSARPPAGVTLPAWVYGIARNLGRDHAKAARHREIAVDALPEAASDADMTTVLAVRRAIEELPPPLREVVTLHELEDNSLRETANALQIPFDTAKDRLRRAREQLRTRLGDDTHAITTERTHTRRRAAASGAAVVAAAQALFGREATAAAAGEATAAAVAGEAIAVAPLAARTVALWIAAVAGVASFATGIAVGRYTAPRARSQPSPVIEVAAAPEPVEAPAEHPSIDEPPTDSARMDHRGPVREPAPGTTRRRDQAAAAPPPAPSTPSSRDEDAEHLILDRARAGLRRGLHDEALVTLMAHERRYPDGALAEERDVLVIEAYLRSGKPAIARRRIERYARDHPAGVLRARVAELAAALEQ